MKVYPIMERFEIYSKYTLIKAEQLLQSSLNTQQCFSFFTTNDDAKSFGNELIRMEENIFYFHYHIHMLLIFLVLFFKISFIINNVIFDVVRNNTTT